MFFGPSVPKALGTRTGLRIPISIRKPWESQFLPKSSDFVFTGSKTDRWLLLLRIFSLHSALLCTSRGSSRAIMSGFTRISSQNRSCSSDLCFQATYRLTAKWWDDGSAHTTTKTQNHMKTTNMVADAYFIVSVSFKFSKSTTDCPVTALLKVDHTNGAAAQRGEFTRKPLVPC